MCYYIVNDNDVFFFYHFISSNYSINLLLPIWRREDAGFVHHAGAGCVVEVVRQAGKAQEWRA